jgi:hypothetical protein
MMAFRVAGNNETNEWNGSPNFRVSSVVIVAQLIM